MTGSINLIIQSVTKAVEYIHQSNKKAQIKYCLVIGETLSGKTQLLSQARFHEHISHDESGSTFSAWHHHHTILIELQIPQLLTDTNQLQSFLSRLSKITRDSIIHSILLTLDSYKINQLNSVSFNDYIHNQIKLIAPFGQALNYAVHLAIFFNKMDSIAGFCDFFDNDSQTTQLLGYSLNHRLNSRGIKKINQKKYDYLIKTLHQKTIKKLHMTRSSVKRHLIREFPLQFEKLSEVFPLFVQLPTKLRLSGVYFTSARQNGFASDQLNDKIQHQFALSIPNQAHQAENEKAYFIKASLIDIINQPSLGPSRDYSQWQQRKTVLSTAVAACVILTAYQYFSFRSQLNETDRELSQYAHLITSPDQLTDALLHLNNAENAINKSHFVIPYKNLNRLKQQVHSNYQQLITEQFLPQLIQQLEIQASNPAATVSQKYQTIKIYRMLTNAHLLDSETILRWYSNTHQQLDKTRLQNQIILLKNSLKQPYQALSDNSAPLQRVLNQLNALPLDYLYYELIKNKLPHKTLSHEIAGFVSPLNKIPSQFSQQSYATIVEKTIPALAKQLNSEQWVLSENSLPTDKLAQILVNKYSKQYAAWWKNAIKYTHALAFNNYQQAATTFDQINRSSSIKQLIQLVKNNTRPIESHLATAKLFNQLVASKFAAINLISNASVNQIQQRFNEISQYFKTLSLVGDNGSTAFELAKNLFNQQSSNDPVSQLFDISRQLPPAIATWVNESATHACFLIIQQAKSYINKQWNQQVFQFYQVNIAEHYPLADINAPEINLTHLNDFFAPQGSLFSFFTQYVQPFLNTESANWVPKEVHGLIMPIPATTITEFARANVIQQMFFADGKRQAQVNFKLQKIALDPVVAQLGITIDDKQLNDNQQTDSAAEFSWPNSQINFDVYSIDGKHYSISEHGTWALFKLLEKFSIANDPDDTSHFELLIDLKGLGAKYALEAASPVNPFITDIVKQFKLFEKLI